MDSWTIGLTFRLCAGAVDIRAAAAVLCEIRRLGLFLSPEKRPVASDDEPR
jgi:hypothetical protein